jgi:hypothetical protein
MSLVRNSPSVTRSSGLIRSRLPAKVDKGWYGELPYPVGPSGNDCPGLSRLVETVNHARAVGPTSPYRKASGAGDVQQRGGIQRDGASWSDCCARSWFHLPGQRNSESAGWLGPPGIGGFKWRSRHFCPTLPRNGGGGDLLLSGRSVRRYPPRSTSAQGQPSRSTTTASR